MNKNLVRLSVVFSGGALGALANSISVWLFGALGIAGALGVSIAPGLTPGWLYPRVVWGGLWGFLFLVPLWKQKPLVQGLIYSLGPTLVQLLIVFPVKAGKGLFGLELGILTPAFVVFYNAVWGVVAAFWINRAE